MRAANVTGSEKCGRCEVGGTIEREVESGLIVIGWRDDGNARVPMFGPCPYCEAGYAKEFPTKARARWRNGYWQGREPDVEYSPSKPFVLSREENGLRLLLLNRRFAKEDVDPAVGLEPLLPEKERLALLMEMTT